MDSRELDRLQQISRCLPDAWSNRRVLYVGAYSERFHFNEVLQLNGCIVDVLEIGEENCEYLRRLSWLNRVIRGDVTDPELELEDYDIVLWSHGPNMVERDKFEQALQLLEKHGDLVVILIPFGHGYTYPGDHDGRPFYMNTHSSYIPADFLKLGYSVNTIGEEDLRGNNLLAWKRVCRNSH